MIIALFSDIHGNASSLEIALKLMEKFKPNKYIFLGDMAGYYYEQNESIKLLNSLNNLISIKGNHDDLFIKSIKDRNLLISLDKKYGKSYSKLANSLTFESKMFFKNLLDFDKNNYYDAYHGSPNLIDEYIYPNTIVNFTLNKTFTFLGHTHYPMIRKINNKYIINPGSIGQSRDHNKGSFAIVDILNKEVEHIRFNYPKKRLKTSVIINRDRSYLLEVLKRVKN